MARKVKQDGPQEVRPQEKGARRRITASELTAHGATEVIGACFKALTISRTLTKSPPLTGSKFYLGQNRTSSDWPGVLFTFWGVLGSLCGILKFILIEGLFVAIILEFYVTLVNLPLNLRRRYPPVSRLTVAHVRSPPVWSLRRHVKSDIPPILGIHWD